MSTVVVAVSGGVDSSMAALLLKRQGHKVIGLTFKNFDYDHSHGQDRSCCSLPMVNRARMVCEAIGIPHYVLNRVDLFRDRVINDFRQAYELGLTPNPCVRCNSLVRWPVLVAMARQLGAHFVSTGHYARIACHNGRFFIRQARSVTKDQSYALWAIPAEFLPLTLLPIGDYDKNQIREMARAEALANADASESQDLCFVSEGRYGDFVKVGTPGEIVNTLGEVIGQHKGLANYTVGQRRGLGIYSRRPLYVLDIDQRNNRLVVGFEEELYASEFSISQTNWFIEVSQAQVIECDCKIRYRHAPSPCKVTVKGEGKAEVRFNSPQRAITPGQSAVFYQGDILLGGGIIERKSHDAAGTRFNEG